VFGSPCFLAFGRHLGIPIVATVSNPLHSWLEDMSGNPPELAFVSNTYSTFNQHMNFKQRLTNVLSYHWFCLQMHYYTNSQLRNVKDNFGLDLAHITELYGDVSLYLVNSHHSLNEIRPMTTNVIEIGGLHLRDDEPLASVRLKKNSLLTRIIMRFPTRSGSGNSRRSVVVAASLSSGFYLICLSAQTCTFQNWTKERKREREVINGNERFSRERDIYSRTKVE